ncbi:MAG: cysteine hydrolase [Bacteroidales bacterium]|nr:cysteine hydrolase [Bacteroidales bacterium]
MENKFELDHPAVIVVDMLVDFVTGALACERGQAMVPYAVELVDEARKAGVPVIFSADAHIPGIDRECRLWGEHAIAGTPGAKVIPELKLSDNDYFIPKRRYSAFFQTNLDCLLRELGVKTVILVGLQAHICVRHTAADAFQLGYEVVSAAQCIEAFTEKDYLEGLEYMKMCYGAQPLTNKEIITAFKA